MSTFLFDRVLFTPCYILSYDSVDAFDGKNGFPPLQACKLCLGTRVKKGKINAGMKCRALTRKDSFKEDKSRKFEAVKTKNCDSRVSLIIINSDFYNKYFFLKSSSNVSYHENSPQCHQENLKILKINNLAIVIEKSTIELNIHYS